MSARQIKLRNKYHRFHARDGSKTDYAEVIFVGERRLSYLWFAPVPGKQGGLLSGPKTLRALAKAILREIPE